MMKRIIGLGLAVMLAAAPAAWAQDRAVFIGLGYFPGHSRSHAYAVSADGAVVVGVAITDNGFEAMRWTLAGGMTTLGGPLTTLMPQLARGISGDGTVIVGRALSETSAEAFRWTEADGAVGLGGLPGGSLSDAYSVSWDGTVIVGRGTSNEAFRWTVDDGMVDLGDLPGGFVRSEAIAVSGDGNVVVGQSRSTNGDEAFRWTEEAGMVGLGDFAGGGFDSIARGVSEDGSVVVGRGYRDCRSNRSGCNEAFRWTDESGLVGLGEFPEPPGSSAYAVSSDGSMVVGVFHFVWDSGNGLRSLGVMLEGLGADVSAFAALHNPTGVSADGRTIVGWGYTSDAWWQQAWAAALCRAGDLNADDLADLSDIPALVTVLLDPASVTVADLCAADLNDDLAIDGADLSAILGAILP